MPRRDPLTPRCCQRLEIFGQLASLTGGGGISGGEATATGGTTGSVGVNVGGLNAPALPGQQNMLLIGGMVLVGLLLWKKL